MVFRYDQLIPEDSATYDVIVAGGGPAGIGAALASAQNGAKTLLLEARSLFGGVATACLWMPFNRILLNGQKRGGVHSMIVQKLNEYSEKVYVRGKRDFINDDGLDIHPEYLRLAIYELLEETGCYYRLYSPVIDTIMENKTIKGVKVAGKNGPQSFYGKVIIDATGDGDVAYHAGAEMVKGREEDGKLMPISLVFALGNVNEEKLFTFLTRSKEQDFNKEKLTKASIKGTFKELIEEAAEEGFITSEWYGFDKTTLPGVVSVNNGGYRDADNFDATSSRDLTRAKRSGLQVALDFVNICHQKKIPGLENCNLVRTGPDLGIRETRRIIGEYVLTVEDARKGTEFEDVVARKYGAIDAVYYHGEMASGFSYPYRSYLPKEIENLLVAGRCGSATHLGHAAGKSMGNMMALGQAAGLAGSLCCQEQTSPRKLNVKKLQDSLITFGVKLFD